MAVVLPIILMIVGFGLVILEVFIPSLGVLTVASVATLVASIYLGFAHTALLGLCLVGAALIGIPILLVISFKVFPNTPLGRHMILARKTGEHPAPATISGRTDLVGREGVATSDLRPSGVARVDGERLDVITRGEMVDAGAHVRIIENRGNRIVVKAIDLPPEPREEEPR